MAPRDSHKENPRCIGGIRLHRLIGSGGYGDVWLGTDGVDRAFAIKLIDHRVSRGGATSREERALRLISENLSEHPNLVCINHIGVEDGVFFYAMELADPVDPKTHHHSPVYEPSTLQSLLAPREPLGIDLCISITLEILSGLEHLHKAGIVHRDLKTSNILRIDGSWKLADFGLATDDTAEVTTAGTIGYLAPNGPLGQSADVYAVGKILYSMLTGLGVSRFPSVVDAIDRIPDRQRFGRVLRVINRACNHLPSERFESVAEFREALLRASDHTRIRRRNRILAVAAGVLLLAAGFFAGLYLSRPEPLGIGTVIQHTTIPFDHPFFLDTGRGSPEFEKPGGEPMRVEVVRDRVWQRSQGGNGHRYLALLVTPDADQWGLVDAEAIAKQLDGYLVALNTHEENYWVFQNLANDRRLWRSYIKPASSRFLNGEFEKDKALRIPEFDIEAQEFYDLYMRDEWRVMEANGRPMLPSIRGPLIGLNWNSGEFIWADGEPLTDTSWLPVQPYVDDQTTHIAFMYANDESLALTPQWSQTTWGNPRLAQERNKGTGFLVEIPR